MMQKFEFEELDLKGAYLIKPFYATDERLKTTMLIFLSLTELITS